MAFELQQLRAVMDRRPDWKERLDRHVSAIETNIEVRPDQCVNEARTLLESVARTLCAEMGLPVVVGQDFPKQMSIIFSALELRLNGHPHAEDIRTGIRQLFGGLNGTMSAISKLSNIEGLRHGAHFDWPTLERRHAAMLGGFCDTLVAFVIEAASNESAPASNDEQEPSFEAASEFNDWIDESHGPVSILEGEYQPSLILFTLDREQYDSALALWEPEA